MKLCPRCERRDDVAEPRGCAEMASVTCNAHHLGRLAGLRRALELAEKRRSISTEILAVEGRALELL